MSPTDLKNRTRQLNSAETDPSGDFVLYWMTSQRRTRWNHALEHAGNIAARLKKPLLVLEALRSDYQHANRRHHSFILDGMLANAKALRGSPARYAAFIEEKAGQGKGLIKALSEQACSVVTDDHPGFFYPQMQASAAEQCSVKLEAVDSCGLYPLHETDRCFHRAYDFRRHLQKTLKEHLEHLPNESPIPDSLPTLPFKEIRAASDWTLSDGEPCIDKEALLSNLPIDQSVRETETVGGHEAGSAALEAFITERLEGYKEDRNHPDQAGTSRLSPYLHYGHIGAHQIFQRITKHESWTSEQLEPVSKGSREGWWNMSPSAEAFLDQFITWRELGLQRAARRGSKEGFQDLPAWALATLKEHEADERPHLYTLSDFEHALTHDDLWNAAQQELLQTGTIHNYLRMLWGKKILHWTASPEEAFEVMLHLNDKYALDGRDPNSFSGILWVLGLHDRPWGPERPVFGKVRYMASKNTYKKLRVNDYIQRWTPNNDLFSTQP